MASDRRQFMAIMGAALLVPAAGRVRAQALGDKTVRTVSDGNLVLPVSFILPDMPAAEREALFAEHGLPTDRFEPECNLTLVEDGDRTVLFDAGAGPNFMPSAGKLGETLAEAGIEPETITDVVFTHAHPDHLWGIIDDFDEIAFPEARLHMGRAEWDFWHASDVLDKVGEARQAFAVGARNRMAVMEDRVQLFEAGTEVLPGIEAVATFGHTPGHMSFAVHGGGDYLMVIGDALTNHALSFAKPGWHYGNDQDPETAAKTRPALLDRLAGDRAEIVGFHLPDGGRGRVERDGAAYRFARDG